MRANRKLAAATFLLAAVLAGLALFQGQRETGRVGPSAKGGSAERARARLESEEQVLRMRLMNAVTTRPLLTALADHVSGPALADLLGSQDWWRDVRADFQVARIIVGGQVLTTAGAPDPGTQDRDVVAQARRAGVASAVATIQGRTYVLLASRVPVLPEKMPVLVLAKLIDDEERPWSGIAFGLWASALLSAIGGALFLFWPARTSTAVRSGSGRLRDPSLESTLSLGTPRPQSAGAPQSRVGTGEESVTISVRGSLAPPQDARAARIPAPAPPKPAPAADIASRGSDGAPGQRFGRYQLLSRLGEGGMSEVFTAVAHGVEGFSRVFVLKRLRRELARDKEAVAQFIDEARMQASLVHSNIVPVFDFGRLQDEYFMTQEYIVGRDLTRVIASFYERHQRIMNPRLAYYVAHETLQALQFAHTRRDRDGVPLGIVHRDVSPGNIILSAHGEVKLADFGIVKSNKRVTRTQEGMVKGNANFMSPEQARGQQVDARSDLFSVAVVLYYCLTNRFVYDGDHDLEVLHKAASGPSSDLAAEIALLPSPAREVLARALSFDPDQRFQTATEFADALAPHIGGAKAEAVEVMQILFGEELQQEAA